jgi:glycosyltransferase involved in cell wall biosynthesis
MPEPLVSVVVATRDRPTRLRSLLDSLRAQTLPAGAFEIVVVDEASGSQTRQLLERYAGNGEPCVRIIRHDVPRGPGGARNAGWRAALAPLIAFTDDDCVATPDWLSAGLAAHRAAPSAIVQGRTCPDPDDASRQDLFARTLRIAELSRRYETCNMFYPRAVLEATGGFDEAFGLTPGGEDTDLGWRSLALGAEPAFSRDAVVYHAIEPLGWRGSLQVASRWTATTRIYAEHPQLRSQLYRGVFWNVWHYLLWRSALALLAPVWLRRLLLTRYVLELRKRARAEGGGAWAVPFFVLHDAVESWAIARGAIRHRTLVL